MRKVLVYIFIISFSLSGFTQNLKSEYRYLSFVKTQTKQLIKDNLRNAEIVSDQLIYSKIKNPKAVSLFFMELGDNYAIIDKAEFALFSYLRQRFLFPNDSISLYVEKQIRTNALHLNIDKQMVDYLIQKSAPYNLAENLETNLNNLIYWSSKIETKELTTILLHQIDLMNSCGMSQFDYLLKWEDLSRIGIPLKYKIDYLEQDFNSLNLKQKKRYYKYQTRYFLKHKAWRSAENSLITLNNLNSNKTFSFAYLKLRSKWNF